MDKIPKDKALQVLSVGTKILLKDVMDTYLRSLGEVKTFYAQKLSTAVETFHDKKPNIVFCEQSFPEGGALDLIQAVGGLHPSGDHYFVLAAEAASDDLVGLAMEKGIDEILVKPFSTENIHEIVERYFEKKVTLELDWAVELRAAKKSFHEKRFQEADEAMASTAKKFWGNTSVLLECADYFLARGHAQHALPLLEKVLFDSPESARALHLSGQVLKKLGRLKEASDKFLKASQLSPLNSLRNMELAETYVQMAEEQVQLALKIENDHSGLMITKARYQLLRKDYGPLVSYLDAKRTFLSDAHKKEADVLVGIAKKLAGLK